MLRLPAFGMYTRRTARGCQDRLVWCTSTAVCILAVEVNATSPSTPAVRRPALRCVACRTLTSVLDQLRNINFCRFLTFGQSPACTAVKILCRSRRTLSSQARQSIASQSVTSIGFLSTVAGGRAPSVGPFTPRAAIATAKANAVIVSNLPFSSEGLDSSSSQAHLPTSARLRGRAPPGIRPVIQRPPGRRSGQATAGFPLSFDCRHWLLGHPVPPGVPPPLRSAYRPKTRTLARCGRTQTRVYHVPHA